MLRTPVLRIPGLRTVRSRPRRGRLRAGSTAAVLLAGTALSVGVARPAAAAGEVYVPAADGSFSFEGHGWGHGRGMSQYGAQGAAMQGLTADAITAFYYPGTVKSTTDALKMPRDIRVQVSKDNDNVTQVMARAGLTLTADGATSVLPSGPSRWQVVVDSAGLHVQSVTGSTTAPYSFGGKSTFAGPVSFTNTSTKLVQLALPDRTSRDYRGAVQAVKTSASTLASVDVLSLEDYLLGVVPREMTSSWQPEAVKAQAIAARSYSAYKRAHVAPTALWDICDTTSCQVYGGAASYATDGTRTALEESGSNTAVQQTPGVIRTYNGAPIFAEFSSSNGGWSVDGDVGYLAAQRDDYDGVPTSSVHSWTARITTAELQASYPAVGTLLRLRVTARDGNGDWGGRVQTVVLEGVDASGQATSVTTTGAAIYHVRSWPAYAAGSGLRSNWWRVVPGPAGPAGSGFTALKPARVLDTRSGAGTPVAAGRTTSVLLRNVAGVPSGATAVAVNVTAVDPTVAGYVTVYPSGQARPVASNLNTTPGVIAPNLVVVALGDDGRIVLYNSAGTVHLVVDVAGYYSSSGGSAFRALTPARLLDTRSGVGAPAGPVAAGRPVSLQVSGVKGLPASGVTAVVLNLTAVSPTKAGFVSVYPTGQVRPTASNLNTMAGQISSNLVMVGLGTSGRVDLYNNAGTVQLVADVAGYFTSGTGSRYHPLSPNRVLDTRQGLGAPAAAVGGGTVISLQIAGLHGVPASGVTAVVLNLTAVEPSTDGYLTAYPSGTARPRTSNLNTHAGSVTPALVVVQVGSDGKVVLYNNAGTVHLVADVEGYESSP